MSTTAISFLTLPAEIRQKILQNHATANSQRSIVFGGPNIVNSARGHQGMRSSSVRSVLGILNDVESVGRKLDRVPRGWKSVVSCNQEMENRVFWANWPGFQSIVEWTKHNDPRSIAELFYSSFVNDGLTASEW